MKFELTKAIDQSARAVREAIGAAKEAEEAIKENGKLIDRLNHEVQDAYEARVELQSELVKKNEATAKATARYNFYINEAVYNPY